MRRFLLASVAALAAVSAAPFASAQTLKVVMHSDLKVLDPIWSGAYIVRNHGYMLYDTLFAMDETEGLPSDSSTGPNFSLNTSWKVLGSTTL
jgi:hypothetical protein